MEKDVLNSTPNRFSQSVPKKTTRNAVCLCTDRRMLIPALFVAEAVQSHSAAFGKLFDIIVFAEPSEVTDVHRRWMEHRGIQLCDDMDLSCQQGVGKFMTRLSPATLMKLSLAEHLDGRYDKILYLDCDLTIHDDVGPIFSLDTTPFALAAAPSGRILVGLSEKKVKKFETECHNLGMTRPYRFFNTGILYIDVEKWNRENLGDRALDFIRKNPELCKLPDEHGLNAVLDGNIVELSPIWNLRIEGWRKIVRESIHPVIIHHAGDDKPWRRFGFKKRLFPDLTAYRLYEDFLRGSPWPGWLEEQWDWSDLRASITWEIKQIVRTLKGTLKDPSAPVVQEYKDAFQQNFQKSRFADVEQGIAILENGKLRLKSGVAAY